VVGACRPGALPKRKAPAQSALIIGAGAAGLTAAHLLRQAGVEVELFEARSALGGRMKRATDFVDFPMPLGAEWLHSDRRVLASIVNDTKVAIATNTMPYDIHADPALYAGADGTADGVAEGVMADLGFTVDQKFIGSSWFDFFSEYVVPHVADRLRLKHVVQSIDYTSDKVVVQTDHGLHSADCAVVTAPARMLQQRQIAFLPRLPSAKLKAIDELRIWGGCKVFIECDETFYPTAVGFEPTTAGQKLFYDAAYGQDSNKNVLGLFAVGRYADPYVARKGSALRDYILAELDALFSNQASRNYIRHIVQKWTKEPFIASAYAADSNAPKTFQQLRAPIDDKIYFAGEAYTDGSDWGSVHAAARSARQTVEALLG